MNQKFIETICLNNGVLMNLSFHQKRVDETVKHFGLSNINLSSIIKYIPKITKNKIFKCKIIYGIDLYEISFIEYFPLIRKKVKFVEANNLFYDFKFEDRTAINTLMSQTDCDDIIIIKNGLVTDSSIANLVFENKQGLFTPATPLLRGTCIRRLLAQKIVKEQIIRKQDIKNFKTVRFVNAMIDEKNAIPFSCEAFL
ncbi:MAG: aminotransferase class IV [Bacteroidales bacterium]